MAVLVGLARRGDAEVVLGWEVVEGLAEGAARAPLQVRCPGTGASVMHGRVHCAWRCTIARSLMFRLTLSRVELNVPLAPPVWPPYQLPYPVAPRLRRCAVAGS